MIMEGTGKYFLIIIFIFFIVYLTVKICMYKIFKNMGLPGWKALVPFYNRLVLTEKLDFNRKMFFKTLIPFVNLYYYSIIISKMLEAHNLNPKQGPLYVLIPMYKFPEFVFRHPTFTLHLYDETEEFITNQQALFEKHPEDETPQTVEEPIPQTILEPEEPQKPNLYVAENIYSNQNLEPDKRMETYVEAKPVEQAPEPETPIIKTVTGRPKVCPNCGAHLSPDATTCFLCGTKLPWQNIKQKV